MKSKGDTIWRGTCLHDSVCSRCKGPIFKGQHCLIYYYRGQKLVCTICTNRDPEWSQWQYKKK